MNAQRQFQLTFRAIALALLTTWSCSTPVVKVAPPTAAASASSLMTLAPTLPSASPHPTLLPAPSGATGLALLAGRWEQAAGANATPACTFDAYLFQPEDGGITLRNDQCRPSNIYAHGSFDESGHLELTGETFNGFESTPLVVSLSLKNDRLTGTRNGESFELIRALDVCASAPSLCSFALSGAVYKKDGTLVTKPLTIQVLAFGGRIAKLQTFDGRYQFPSLPYDRLSLVVYDGERLLQRRDIKDSPLIHYLINFGGPKTSADPGAEDFAVDD